MRFKNWLEETTLTTDIAKNLAKGHVDVIGAPKYKKKKRKTRLDKREYNIHEKDIIKKLKIFLENRVNETTVSSAIVGSQQTRVTGSYRNIVVLRRQPKPLKFNSLLGAYLPSEEDVEEEQE